ncbi:hypothetical protein [Cupriavidus sp. CP313]
MAQLIGTAFGLCGCYTKADSAIAPKLAGTARDIISPQDFGATGRGTRNDMPAFKEACERPHARVVVPPGEYLFEFSSANKLNDMINVGAGTEIVFREGAKILYSYNGLPLFNFVGVSHCGVYGAVFEFIGDSQKKADYRFEAYLRRVGLGAVFKGGDYELSSVIMAIGCDYCVFDGIRAHSRVRSNASVIGYLLNLKEKASGGGYARGNVIRNIDVSECVNPILVGGQDNLIVENVHSDARGANYYIAPGHVLYTSGPANLPNVVKVSNIYDGPTVLGFPEMAGRNLATLAVKQTARSSFTYIRTFHPEGILQSLSGCNDVLFEDIIWRSGNVDMRPTAPAINILDNGIVGNYDIRFVNVSLIADGKYRPIANTGSVDLQRRFKFSHIYIETDVRLGEGQSAPYAIIDWRGSDSTFEDVRINAIAAPVERANVIAEVRQGNNNKLDIKLVGHHASVYARYMPSSLRNMIQLQVGERDASGSGKW